MTLTPEERDKYHTWSVKINWHDESDDAHLFRRIENWRKSSYPVPVPRNVAIRLAVTEWAKTLPKEDIE